MLGKGFEVYIEEDGVAERASFIVNPQGKIVAYEVIAGNVGRNADELFRRVQAQPVCGRTRRRGVPGQMAARRRHSETKSRSGGAAVIYGR